MSLLSKILVTSLAQIEVPGGNVMHAIKTTDLGFSDFGEAYFSSINYTSIKAWKRHTKMTMNIIVPVGRVLFAFAIKNENDFYEFRSEEIGGDNYSRITVPPMIWFGFQGMSPGGSLALNIANIAHDPNEIERLNLEKINFPWKSAL